MVQATLNNSNNEMKAFLVLHFPELEPTIQQELSELWNKDIELKKGERIEDGDHSEPKLYFIQEGCLKAAQETSETEMVFAFGWKGHCMFNLPRFISSEENETYLEAVRNTRLLAIAKHDFIEILGKSAILQRLWQENLNQILLERIEREALFMHGKPAERVQWLKKRYPEIFSKVPQVHIAAFLGIRQETLSRLLHLD